MDGRGWGSIAPPAQQRSIDIVKRGLAIGRELLRLVFLAQKRAKRAVRGGRRVERAVQNNNGNARLVLQVVGGA